MLPFLTPYDVTGILPTCRFLNRAGELPAYWIEASSSLRLMDDREGEQKARPRWWDLGACQRNSASGVNSMQEDAFWDPAPFLGRPGTIRNLFKLAAARTDPLFITTVLHFLNLAPHHPALECPSFCAELNPAVWAELQLPRPPLTEGESGVPTRLPDSFEATLNEHDRRFWLVDDRRRSQRKGSRPNIVKILEAARFQERRKGRKGRESRVTFATKYTHRYTNTRKTKKERSRGKRREREMSPEEEVRES